MNIIPIVLYVGAWIAAFVLSALQGRPFWDELLRFMLFFSVGVQGLWAFIGHCFYSEEASAHIGWKTSPFQYEVGIANLSFGVLGILCYGYPGLWIATSIGISIFMLGAAWGHFLDMRRNANFAPGNAGSIFYTDIFIPITLMIALIF